VSRLVLQRTVKAAIRRAKIAKAASCQTFRRSFATHSLEAGCEIRTVQGLLGCRDLNTAIIYAHVLNRRQRRSEACRSVVCSSVAQSLVGGGSAPAAEHGAFGGISQRLYSFGYDEHGTIAVVRPRAVLHLGGVSKDAATT
jgi:Phage integrase family